MSQRPTTLQALSARVRRFQLVLGIGLGSAVAGGIVSAALVDRLGPRIQALGPGVLALFAHVLVSRLWVLGMLPLVCYLSARIFDLKPWRTAAAAGLAGEAFFLALGLLTGGLDGLLEQWPDLVLNVLTLALGIALGRRAILRGRAAAGRAEEAAKRRVEANKSQYAEYLREAERVAGLHETSSAKPAGEAAVIQAPAPETAAPAEPPEPAAPALDGTKPG